MTRPVQNVADPGHAGHIDRARHVKPALQLRRLPPCCVHAVSSTKSIRGRSDPGAQGALRLRRHPAALDPGPSGRLQCRQPAQRRPARRRALVRRHLQRGAAAGERSPARRRHARLHRPGAIHADVHEQVLHEFMEVNGIDPKPILDQIEYLFAHVLAPTRSTNPKRRLNHLCDRLWFIAAIEHYTAVLGDFALNCAWDDYGAARRWSTCSAGTAARKSSTAASPTTSRATSRQLPRPDPRDGDGGGVHLRVLPARPWYLLQADPQVDIGWWRRCNGCGARLQASDCCPSTASCSARTPCVLPARVHPGEMGSTAQAVAYLASSPAARAAHL